MIGVRSITTKAECDMRFAALAWSLALASSMTISGCATKVSNVAIRDVNDVNGVNGGYTFEHWIAQRDSRDLENGDLIVLSFSGGGSRAAALSAAVLDTLAKEGLSRKIAIISATSGGSLAAGFYAAQGDAGLAHFRTGFLETNNERALTSKLLPGLLYGENRSRAFADYIDAGLLTSPGKPGPPTYADLMSRWPDAPFVIMNATDASTGFNVELTQDYFSHLCSDLGKFRVSEAIAASASFPFLMTPIPLKNFSGIDGCARRLPSYSAAYASAYTARYTNLEGFIKARYFHSLRNTVDASATPADGEDKPYRSIQFVHLIDGGLSDNLAARALLRAFSPEILDQLVKRKLKRIMLIQVNAKSEAVRPIDRKPDAPSISEIVDTVVFNPLDVTTTLSSYVSKNYWVQLVRSVNSTATMVEGQRTADITFFPVQVDFDQMTTGSDDQKQVKKIGTAWRISAADLALIEKTGRDLLLAHPCYAAFMMDAGLAKAPEQVSGCDKVGVDRLALSAPPAVPVAAPPPAPPPMPVPVSERISLASDALFEFDDFALSSAGERALDALIFKMQGLKVEAIAIAGHTDSIGPDEYNRILSLRRAEAIKHYLISRGIEEAKMVVEGKGETQPVGDNATASGRANNRRVTIDILASRQTR